MESANLDSALPSEAALEAQLKASPLPPLADAGFTRRVLNRLPAARSRWAEWWAPAVGAAAGLGVVFRHAVSWPDWATLSAQVENALASESPWLTALAVIAALTLFPALEEMAD